MGGEDMNILETTLAKGGTLLIREGRGNLC